MSILGDPIVLVNRTSKPLTFKANGQDHVLEPGDNFGYNTGHAEFAYKQHPVPGTADYGTLEFMSKIGIKRRDGTVLYDCSPLTDEFLEQMADLEYFDVASLPPGAQAGRQREKAKFIKSMREASSRGTLNAAAVGE